MRYVCKNCGKFVSNNSTVCKSCGTENPAITVEERRNSSSASNANTTNDIKKVECPYCNVKFNIKDTTAEHINCPECGSEMENPYQSETDGRIGLPRIIIGIVVIAVLIFNIYRAIQSSTKSYQQEISEITAQPTTEPVRIESTNAEKPTISKTPNTVPNAQKKTGTRLVFRSAGAGELTYYWIFTEKGNQHNFEYRVSDGHGYRILKSGRFVTLTYGQLKSQSPNVILDGVNINNSKKIFLAGPIEEYEDSYGNSHNVYAIVVPYETTAKVLLNDTYNPDEFLLLENLVRE